MLDEKEREFAKACLESGITDLDSSANIERSKLIAKQKKLNNYENVEELQQLINTFIEEKNEKEREKNKKKVEKKKAEEKEKKKLLEKYENASGRDKTIRYLDDLIEEAQFIIDERDEAVKSADDIKKVYAALGKSVEPVKSPPKQDWAIAGGIASAIAGPAAGIAIASDIQRKNAESRIDPEEAAQEAQRFKDSLKETGDSLAEKIIENSGISAGDYRTAKGRKADLLKQKEKCEVLLVDDTVDQYQLLSMLNPQIEKITVSETGSVHITVQVTGNIYTIYNEVPAVIDGSFRALLWNEKGECCGIAAIVLPVYGVSNSSLLEAWFTLPSDKEAIYSVEFTKPNLWLIETLNVSKSKHRSEIVSIDNNFSENAELYYDAYKLMDSSKASAIKKASSLFDSLGEWKDAVNQKQRCDKLLREIEEKEKREVQERNRKLRAERQKQEEIKAAKVKKIKIIGIFCTIIVAFIIVSFFC